MSSSLSLVDLKTGARFHIPSEQNTVVLGRDTSVSVKNKLSLGNTHLNPCVVSLGNSKTHWSRYRCRANDDKSGASRTHPGSERLH